MEKSIILPFSKENIESKTPSSVGVLMLRSTPVNGDIILITVSDNLKNDFLKLFTDGSEAKYFDWYSTDTKEEAEAIKTELIDRYHLSHE